MPGVKAAIKFILTSLGLVLIGIGVVGTLVMAQMQSALTRGASDVLSKTFDQTVTVGAVYVDPVGRALVLSDFQLKNPEGFPAGPMLEAKAVHVEPGFGFFWREDPAIRRIRIEDADIFFRYRPLQGGSNLAVFADKLEERSAQLGRRVQVGEIVAEQAEFHFASDWLPTEALGVRLVDVSIQDPGGEKSLTPAQVTSIFLRSVVKEAVTLRGLLGGGAD